MDGVRGRIGKSLYLVIANLHMRAKNNFLNFYLENVSTREVVKEA